MFLRLNDHIHVNHRTHETNTKPSVMFMDKKEIIIKCPWLMSNYFAMMMMMTM